MKRFRLKVPVLVQHPKVTPPPVEPLEFIRLVEVHEIVSQIHRPREIIHIDVRVGRQQPLVAVLRRAHHHRYRALRVRVPPELLRHVLVAVGILEGQVEHVAGDGGAVGLEVSGAGEVAALSVDVDLYVLLELLDVFPAVVAAAAVRAEYRDEDVAALPLPRVVEAVDGFWADHCPSVGHGDVGVHSGESRVN